MRGLKKRFGHSGFPGMDEAAAAELDLYAENEASLYNQKMSIIKNIQRRLKSGKYDHSKAPKLWAYWVESAAKAYAKEFGEGQAWHKMFDKPTRDALAQQFADHYIEVIRGGEYD